MTRQLGSVEQFIVDLAVYEEEPFHVLASALLAEGVCASPDDIVEPLISLVEAGMLRVRFHSGHPKDDYLPVSKLTAADLSAHVKRNGDLGFSSYPRTGGELFFQTSEIGRPFVQGLQGSQGERAK